MGNTTSTTDNINENQQSQPETINKDNNKEPIENVILTEDSNSDDSDSGKSNIYKENALNKPPLRESFHQGASLSSPTLPNTNNNLIDSGSMIKSNSTSDLTISQVISSPSQSPQTTSNRNSTTIISKNNNSNTIKKIIQGELQKRGHVFKNWRARWFKIENGHLLYFKSKEDILPIDKIPLRGSRVSKKPFYERPHTFELISTNMNKVFLFQGKDLHEVDFWMTEIIKEQELARILSRSSSLLNSITNNNHNNSSSNSSNNNMLNSSTSNNGVVDKQ